MAVQTELASMYGEEPVVEEEVTLHFSGLPHRLGAWIESERGHELSS